MIHSYKSIPGKSIKMACISGLILIFLILTSSTVVVLHAQDQPKHTVQLSSKQLKSYEGVFQNPRNNDMNVQFVVKDDGLTAKLLWNNVELKLTPESDSVFTVHTEEEGPDHIIFVKDAAGMVTKISLGRNEFWNKVDNYKPVVKVEMKHTAEQLKPYEGLYQLQGNRPRFIQMTVKDNGIVLKQHWDATEIRLLPETELDFFSREAPLFSCTFTKATDGTVTQALIFKRDKWDKLKKIELTTTQLKTVEGKYQFKDDPDNYIQLTIRNNKLVVKQLWDNKEIILDPQTETYFYNNEQSYPLQVMKDQQGKVIQVLVLGIDLFDKVEN